MKEKLSHHWYRLPGHIRKPVVLTIGLAFVLAAGLIGWLPGPGGIPLFLIGVAILATEYAWAERFKRRILAFTKLSGQWLRQHSMLAATAVALFILSGVALVSTYLLR